MQINITDSKLVPAYRQISEHLKQYIVDENLQYGTALPTVKDIANFANVSIRTADRGTFELVKEGICFRLPKKGTFVAKALHQQVQGKRVCGILMSRKHNDLQDVNLDLVSSSLYRGMREEATQYDMDLITLNDNAESSVDFYKNNEQINFSGIISLDNKFSRGIALADEYPDLSIIHINYHTPEFDISPDNVFGIFNDDFSGAYQIMNSMLAKGHRKVLILTLKEENDNCLNRVKGYKMALQNSDFETVDYLEEYDIHGKHDVNHKAIACMLLDDFFKTGKAADVIMCTNDLLAEAATGYIKQNNISDIEVCGYDNIMPDKSRIGNFSTVAIDFEAMGKQAIKMLQDNKKTYPKSIKTPPQLISRSGK
jgi:GntR family transcriptional regulator, arabinose operon transcriptional repressor